MSISLSPSPAIAVSRRSFLKPLDTTSPEAEFLKEAKKTPAERIRAAVLKKLGLTEEELAAMDSAAKAAIEKIIKQEIEQKLKAKTGEGAAHLADLDV